MPHSKDYTKLESRIRSQCVQILRTMSGCGLTAAISAYDESNGHIPHAMNLLRLRGTGMQSAYVRPISAPEKLPHELFRPTVYPDGDRWCALYGDNLQEGVAGFGRTPAEAVLAFDVAWATLECSQGAARQVGS